MPEIELYPQYTGSAAADDVMLGFDVSAGQTKLFPVSSFPTGLAVNGNGSELTGITAEQVGADASGAASAAQAAAEVYALAVATALGG